ncbi:MAG: tRNA lysidine(34) synthetase TilS [Chloroflexota bacterium]
MLENIKTILRDQCGLTKDSPIIVGVSGGPDSMCLMQLLRQAGYPIIVAHFNHQLRPESDVDANSVEQTAARLMIPSMVDGADVRTYADEEGLSIEEAARNLRYRFLFRLARERNAQAVAVGHTADDQVETVLMHFLRGSGLSGLKGMSYRSILKTFDPEIPVVRPLLDISREETVVYCAAHGLRPHYDPSNDSLNFLRNRLRHLLIPNLETYNPKFREAVLRMTHSLKADHTFIKEALELAWRECVTDSNPEMITFSIDRLSRQPLGLQRNLVRQAIQTLRPGQDTNYAAIERATTFINDPDHPVRVDLVGGVRLFREGDCIYVCTPNADLPINRWPLLPEAAEPILVSLPGAIELSGGWKFSCEKWRLPALAREQAEKNEDQFQVWLDAEVLPSPLELRTRRPGDRFEPLGMDGHSQKLSDFLVNEKMPQRARDRWPLLCSGDVVVWIPGYRPAHPFRLKTASRNVIYLAVTQPLERPAEENPSDD